MITPVAKAATSAYMVGTPVFPAKGGDTNVDNGLVQMADVIDNSGAPLGYDVLVPRGAVFPLSRLRSAFHAEHVVATLSSGGWVPTANSAWARVVDEPSGSTDSVFQFSPIKLEVINSTHGDYANGDVVYMDRSKFFKLTPAYGFFFCDPVPGFKPPVFPVAKEV